MTRIELLVLTLDSLLTRLPTTTGGEALLQGFVPPPRFSEKRFDNYRPDSRYPSQGAARSRLRGVAARLAEARRGWARRLRSRLFGEEPGSGLYLDGGFGVGKTHLLAALWHASPGPKAFLSFDELVYTIGLLGTERTRKLFAGQQLVAIDEWELDDPGNLKMALAFLRGAIADGVTIATTSNTIPAELGEGRFSQKDFLREIEELSRAFELLSVRGEDYRHRHFEADPGREYFWSSDELRARARSASEDTLLVRFEELLEGLERIHPIRYAALAEAIRELYVEDVRPIDSLPDALRWVHFVDKLYDSGTRLAASSTVALGEIFPRSFMDGPYQKKFSRCLSRMEELLGETAGEVESDA